jgi:hypothetical protein
MRVALPGREWEHRMDPGEPGWFRRYEQPVTIVLLTTPRLRG